MEQNEGVWNFNKYSNPLCDKDVMICQSNVLQGQPLGIDIK